MTNNKKGNKNTVTNKKQDKTGDKRDTVTKKKNKTGDKKKQKEDKAYSMTNKDKNGDKRKQKGDKTDTSRKGRTRIETLHCQQKRADTS